MAVLCCRKIVSNVNLLQGPVGRPGQNGSIGLPGEKVRQQCYKF